MSDRIGVWKKISMTLLAVVQQECRDAAQGVAAVGKPI